MITKDDVERIFQAMALKSTQELEEIAGCATTTQLEKVAARTWLRAGETGDMSEIRRILDTSIGKLIDTTLNANVNTDIDGVIDGIPTQDLVALARKK